MEKSKEKCKYDNTLLLPVKKMTMKVNLSELGSKAWKFWEKIDLYSKMRTQRLGKEPFVLLLGPPYANGHLHMGHGTNINLKSIIMQYKYLLGYDMISRIGFDCHGLPIELKVEEQNREKFKNSTKTLTEFRQDCKNFAELWIKEQSDQMKALGFITDYNNPYKTTSPEAQVEVISTLCDLLLKGYIFREQKPISWSVKEQTALSDSETEYKEHVSTAVDIGLMITLLPTRKDLENSLIVIWTTTPWTLLGNMAVAFKKDLIYCLIRINDFTCIIAKDLIGNFIQRMNTYHEMQFSHEILEEFTGEVFQGGTCTHPLLDKEVPLLHSDHVTNDTGTGFVHIAPAHGEEDFLLAKQYNIKPIDYIDEKGYYTSDAPLFVGGNIFDENIAGPWGEILNFLRNHDGVPYFTGMLLSCLPYKHSTLYSQRGKCPIIYKLSYQWFIDLDTSGLREHSLKATEGANWIPQEMKKAMKNTLSSRKEWCISRDRVWGVPIPFFFHKKTQKPLLDKEIYKNIIAKIEECGYDSWYSGDPLAFIEHKYNKEDYGYSNCIVDIWLESGLVARYALKNEGIYGENVQVDMVCEGIDQLRGWFHTLSMFYKEFPAKNVFVHGFITNEDGSKMSKSSGKTISVSETLSKYGIDSFRQLTGSSDIHHDVRLGDTVLTQAKEFCEQRRNILRFLVGVTPDTILTENIDATGFSSIEKWMLYCIFTLTKEFELLVESYQHRTLLSRLQDFITESVSLYINSRKDILYCDSIDSSRRKSVVYVATALRDFIIRWSIPVMPSIMEECYQSITGKDWNSDSSVYLSKIGEYIDDNWSLFQENYNAVENAIKLLPRINTVTEKYRQDKTIHSKEEARVIMNIPHHEDIVFELSGVAQLINNKNLEEDILVEKTSYKKCMRCWVMKEELHNDEICARCQEVVK